jgi:hypothetical protein
VGGNTTGNNTIRQKKMSLKPAQVSSPAERLAAASLVTLVAIENPCTDVVRMRFYPECVITNCACVIIVSPEMSRHHHHNLHLASQLHFHYNVRVTE